VSPAAEPILRGERISFAYGEPPLLTPVLDALDLALHPGELTVLMGPSGSGKTTLISILAGLLRPTSGEVTLAGERLTSMRDADVTAARRRHLGFVFQTFHLFQALSATDNVAEVLALTGVPIRAARERSRALLTRFGLGERLDHLPSQLSAGQRQRVAIARALAPGPKIVIADEPTVALDGPTAKEVMTLLREYVGRGTSVVLVTHDLRILAPTDRVVELEDGRVVRDGRGLSGLAHARERLATERGAT
jgi:putative ABC transport system ATP-binding protein